MQSPPPAPRSINPGIPEPLDRLVSQCIKPDAAERFQTTPQLVAALNRLDNRGQLLPVVRRVTRRLAAAVLGVFVALARPDLVARAGAARAGRARARLGVDRRLPERDRRPDLRPHARADSETRARRGWLHQRLRPERDPPQPRCASARDPGRTGRPGAGREAGRQRRPFRFGRATGQPVRGVGQSGPGGHGQRDRRRDKPGLE